MNTRRKGKKKHAAFSGHHVLAVGDSIDHLDWHCRNLWDGAWKTIKDVTQKEHRRIHSKKRTYSPVPRITRGAYVVIGYTERKTLYE